MGAPAELRTVRLIPKLEPLRHPHRYKVVVGGRGKGGSWGIARQLLLDGVQSPLRTLCAREIQRTIKDSVHQLLSDQIAELELGWFYTIRETEIAAPNGSLFSFAGLRGLDAEKIKSYEGYDRAWVEEAENITKRSWNILIPTIRREGSEIWVNLNPQLESDETYQRFVVNPPPDALVIKMNWRDNPWFPDVLEKERRYLEKTDPEEYANIWEGRPRTSVVGAIYSKEMASAVEEQRVRAVPYDPKLKVHTVWDLGWNDQTAIIFAQRVVSEVRVIDYDEESFLRPDQWAKRLIAKPYIYGNHWLPHDGDYELQASGGQSMRKILKPMLGREPKIIAKPKTVEVPIKAARLMFPRVYVDQNKCARLLECLKRFRRGVPESTGEPGAPVKDEFRHGADAFGYLAMIVDQLTNEDPKPRVEAPASLTGAAGWMA